MRLTIASLLVVLLLSGCQTQRARRPIDPEALGMQPKMEPTPDEAMELSRDAISAYAASSSAPFPRPPSR